MDIRRVIRKAAQLAWPGSAHRAAMVDPRNDPPYSRPPASSVSFRSALRVDLSGHVALVTGASGELGRTIARTLGACGADIAIHCFRGQERAAALESELHAFGVRTCVVSGNISHMQSVLEMRQSILDRLGPVDILVTNAVAWSEHKRILDQSIEAFDSIHRSCVLHNLIAAKVFVPCMIEHTWGRIIAISSEVAMQALPDFGDYTAGKRGMDGLLRVLAREVGEHQITVNQVAPGWVISDKDRQTHSEIQPDYERTVPLKRRGYDHDVANAVAFLASDIAAFISGVYLPVCGGNVMPGI